MLVVGGDGEQLIMILVACFAGVSSCATFSCPCMMPLAHGFRLREAAPVKVKIAQVVDRVQRRPVVWLQCLLFPRQCPLVT